MVHELLPATTAVATSGYATYWNLRQLFGRVVLAPNPDAQSSRVLVQLALPEVYSLLSALCSASLLLLVTFI